MTVLTAIFWVSAGLLVYAHAGYPVTLWILGFLGFGNRAGETRGRKLSEIPPPIDPTTEEGVVPSVSLIIAAYNEEAVIEAKVRNALALEYPRDLLEIIVASDGSTDRTVEIARETGADRVLDLPRGGKIAAQNAAAEAATGALFAFSDANSIWEPEALIELTDPFRDPRVGYVCGQVSFVGPDGGNLEGVYWRYEMRVRELESSLAGVTAGNGAIYAVRPEDYIPLDPAGSHDLSLPFALAKRRRLSLYRPRARAREKVVPTLQGELGRKRRMMVGLWDIVIGEGMIDPRGYPPTYLLEIFSHRILRYISPALHLTALITSAILAGTGTFWKVMLGIQVLVLLAAVAGRWIHLLPLRVCRYYVMVTLAIPLGLWDRWRQGSPGRWEKTEGTR